ncbi:MAG: hypothetical protein M3Y21_01095 [Candidatus Eremiobacteraeota bacterium]|nr:hypothetical protein [Candidatus Eremiobacteraeota bacterium]
MRALALTVVSTIIAALVSGSTALAAPDMNLYGGPIYTGVPALSITSAFLQAGGGPGSFSTVRALGSMFGQDEVSNEFAKLKTQYGQTRADQFVKTSDFAVRDAFEWAGKDNLKFPASAAFGGSNLGLALEKSGETNRILWTGYLLDKLFTHKITMQVMADIDAKFGTIANSDYHRISNQLFYDLNQSLGGSATLAPFH